MKRWAAGHTPTGEENPDTVPPVKLRGGWGGRGGITAVFDAKKNAESQNAKRTFERSEHHCFMKRTLIEQ